MESMGRSPQKRSELAQIWSVSSRLLAAVAMASLVLVAAGCHDAILVDTAPLDAAGMSYDSMQQVKSLNATTPEVGELAKARQGGLSDANCVKILQIFRAQGQPFTAGETIVGLMQAGIGESTVVELAKLNQLGFTAGELEAMRLAGLSDETILEVARRHAQGQTVLSGASLAGMKNAGLRDSTLLELSRRGIPDSQTAAIIALRRQGLRDEEILKHFAGS
jgi:hypothetical protein